MATFRDQVFWCPDDEPAAPAELYGCSRLIMICIDGLDPGYLDLGADGEVGAEAGGELMPRLHRFLRGATWFADARAFLPAATDMNHLNALAGTDSSGTGLVCV